RRAGRGLNEERLSQARRAAKVPRRIEDGRAMIGSYKKEKAAGRFLVPRPCLKLFRLPLGVLVAAAGFWLAVLFALHHAVVAGHETFLAHRGTELRVHLNESAGDAEADGFGLAVDAATLGGDENIVGVRANVRGLEGRHDGSLLAVVAAEK